MVLWKRNCLSIAAASNAESLNGPLVGRSSHCKHLVLLTRAKQNIGHDNSATYGLLVVGIVLKNRHM